MSNEIPYLSGEDLSALAIPTDEVIAMIERLLVAATESRAWNASKPVITPPDGRYMMATLSAADDPRYLAVKSLVMNARNRARGLSHINALVTLLDSETGLPLAIIDGNWVTAVRTAGLSATAARYMARPDSASIAFVGCGVQALSHLDAFKERFPLREVHAFGRGRESRDRFCRAAEGMGLVVHASDDIQAVVANADIVVTSVSWSNDVLPFIDAAWLRPGTFVSVVDLAVSWHAASFSSFDRIITDDLEQERNAAEPLVDLSLLQGDLTGLITKSIIGRGDEQETNAFVFRGLALGDLALAALAFEAAKRATQ